MNYATLRSATAAHQSMFGGTELESQKKQGIAALVVGVVLQTGAVAAHYAGSATAMNGLAVGTAVAIGFAAICFYRMRAPVGATLQRTGLDDLRMQSALEACKTNVMIADDQYNIVYMNATMLAMMRAAEAELRNDIPTLNSNKLIGVNIDTFHKNPAHQRRILEGLSGPIETDLSIGGCSFHLVVTPIFQDGSKVRLGTVVEWQDLTAARAAEKIARRLQAALDSCQTNVMVANESYDVVYMNDTMLQMIRAAEGEMRKDVPALDSSKLIGANIDMFHKNPAHQRRILDGLSGPIETDLAIGGRSFHLVVTPVFEEGSKKRLGTVVEWQDLTAAKAAEREALRVRAALDTCQTNVMVANEHYNIVYMNNTMLEMIRAAESEIRKDVPALDSRKLIGANIDIFHKNPAHQRRILDGLTGPIETDLRIGGRSFHLVVSPVVDKDGKRLGTSVEWKDETSEKAIEAEIDGVAKAAVAGDFSRQLPLEGKKGFMLNLATAMNGLCQNTAGALDDLVRMLSALADGDLTQRITADYQGAFAKLKTDANVMADRLSSTIGEIKMAAREVSSATAEITTSTTDLSQRTEEQAASLEQTSASMEQMSATVKKNAESAQEANHSAASTRDVADRGGQVVAKVVDAMARIEELSRKISDIIGVIDEIARQTNLLALNAAVEAARAGEAGRGFAVVASEVRSLAQRSSQAAKDIKDLIISSNSQVKDGVDLVNKAGSALNEIVELIKKVADIVADIASASAEQAGGIEQVNKALTQMDEVTQQNSALVEENAATAKTLEHQANLMDERVAFFRVDDVEVRAPLAVETTAAAPKVAEIGTAQTKSLSGKPAVAARKTGNGANGAAAAASRRGPAGRTQAALATAVKDPEWKEF